MVEIGYKLSSEEHPPNDLIAQARRAEESGFSFAMISDHFHPWIDAQGQSPFVWSVIGAIAQATKKLLLGTAVTCPSMRIHPGIIAQAAATAASMMPGRFILGLGAGENLNEHIFGHRWPPVRIRHAMLKEAVEISRRTARIPCGGHTPHCGPKYGRWISSRSRSVSDLRPIYGRHSDLRYPGLGQNSIGTKIYLGVYTRMGCNYLQMGGIPIAQSIMDATPHIHERRRTNASKTVNFIGYRF